MTIVALIGSLRKKSYNRAIFNHYQKMAKDQVAVIEGEYSNFPMYNDDLKEDGFPPEVIHLADQIREADAVLFFSPEYNYSVPGPLKNALDWLSRVQDQPFSGKPTSIISASPGRLGGARMQYHLRQIGVFLDMRILNKPEVMISEVHEKVDKHGQLTDEATAGFLKKHLDQLRQYVLSDQS